ncbi:MAG: hypothetical protein NTZ50_09460, partial [Chloroflexi bacterium]|nr:hypothetical protein [Chloroflexota bacterium]
MSRQKFWRQIRLPRKAGEANLPDKTYGQELIDFRNKQGSNAEGLGKGCQSIKVHVAQQGTR